MKVCRLCVLLLAIVVMVIFTVTMTTASTYHYVNFNDASLNTSALNYMREVCDGGTPWTAYSSEGKQNVSCLDSTDNWMVGIQFRWLLNWTETNITVNMSALIPGCTVNCGVVIGWGGSNYTNTSSPVEAYLPYIVSSTTSTVGKDMKWISNGTGITIIYDGSVLGHLPINEAVTNHSLQPTIWPKNGGAQFARMELFNITVDTAEKNNYITPIDMAEIKSNPVTTGVSTSTGIHNATFYYWGPSGLQTFARKTPLDSFENFADGWTFFNSSTAENSRYSTNYATNGTYSYTINGQFGSGSMNITKVMTEAVNVTLDLTVLLTGAAVPVVLVDGSAVASYANGTFLNQQFNLSAGQELQIWAPPAISGVNVYVDNIRYNATYGTTQSFYSTDYLTLGTYTWNAFICDSAAECSFMANNRTFTLGLVTDSVTYQNPIQSGALNNIEFNFSVGSGATFTSAFLVYNGTNYSTTLTQINSTFYRAFSSFTTPTVTSAATKNFFLYLTSSMGAAQTQTLTQNVTTLLIDDCSAYSLVLLNYTLYDEDSLSIINPTLYNSTIRVDVSIFNVGGDVLVGNFSRVYNVTNEAIVCIDNSLANSTFKMNAVAEYSADTYATEYYNIQQKSITNNSIPLKIPLYIILSARIKNFLITYRDTFSLPQTDVLVQISRQYVGAGELRTIEIPKTGPDGKTSAALVQHDVVYTFTVTRNNSVLATFSNVVVACQNEVINECNINLKELFGTQDYGSIPNIADFRYTASLDRDARTIAVNYVIPSGSTALVQINGTKADRFGTNQACTDSILSSMGVLTCSIPASFGNQSVILDIYKDNELVASNTYSLGQAAYSVAGPGVFIYAAVLVISLGFIAVGWPALMIVGAVAGLVASGVFLLVEGVTTFGVGATLSYLIVATIIGLWAVTRRGDTV